MRSRCGMAMMVAAALVSVGCTPASDIRAQGTPSAAAARGAATAAAPVPSPSPSVTVAPSESARGRLVIHGTGDVNLDPSYIPALRTHGYDHPWTGLSGLFAHDDLTIINLECAVSALGRRVPKAFNFRCDPAALPAMRNAGVEVANLANNHGGDFGPEALLDSRTQLEQAGIAPVGVGDDATVANAPALFERNGWTIAVLGFGGVVPSSEWLAGPGHPGMADGNDIASMTAAVRAADELADLVFVTIHWGRELDTEPQAEDVARAQAMIDAGADGIFGHHAHRLQPLGWYKDRPIAWGLGNFVWPVLSAAGSRTAVAEFVVRPDGSMAACLLPAEIVSSGHPVLKPLPGSCG